MSKQSKECIIRDICDLHRYSKCHFDKIKKDLEVYEEKVDNLRNYDNLVNEAKKDIDKAMDNIITPKLKITDIFQSKLDDFFTKTLEDAMNKMVPQINDLILYKDLQILKKFNKSRTISANMCNDDEKNQQLILDIYNNHIIRELKKYNAEIENITDKNYYKVVIYDIKPFFDSDKEIVDLIDDLKEHDLLLSLKFMEITKKIFCGLFAVPP